MSLPDERGGTAAAEGCMGDDLGVPALPGAVAFVAPSAGSSLQQHLQARTRAHGAGQGVIKNTTSQDSIK